MSRIRIVPVVVSLLIAFSLLFGGWEMYAKFGLVRPLEEQLKADPSVTQVESVVDGTTRSLKVTIKPVDDLQATYENLETIALNALGSQVKLQLVDTRGEDLKKEYRAIQPILYAGIAKGDFPQMIQDAQKTVAKDGTQAQVSMNDKYVFVSLQRDGRFLYEVLPYVNSTAYGQLKEVQSL
ncbi:hypothetical protein [Tumebacillus permanentifrigoris]|uniref:Uncharacterized protein n=1 Tax=Tumebacillus permanentifrigoris TaxID=378543 RepID=A0A316DYK7_9BACL|nr:hypothetical protein [Tumebacillus permanentifrigoris]PWK15590.1 hypothetical protein C7459_103127 [Tumebacillus permanentifrigoris]